MLSASNRTIESLYLSNNPFGNSGAPGLGPGLCDNTSLLHLTLASCGINDEGAKCVLASLNRHLRLMTLVIGQSCATEGLGIQ